MTSSFSDLCQWYWILRMSMIDRHWWFSVSMILLHPPDTCKTCFGSRFMIISTFHNIWDLQYRAGQYTVRIGKTRGSTLPCVSDTWIINMEACPNFWSASDSYWHLRRRFTFISFKMHVCRDPWQKQLKCVWALCFCNLPQSYLAQGKTAQQPKYLFITTRTRALFDLWHCLGHSCNSVHSSLKKYPMDARSYKPATNTMTDILSSRVAHFLCTTKCFLSHLSKALRTPVRWRIILIYLIIIMSHLVRKRCSLMQTIKLHSLFYLVVTPKVKQHYVHVVGCRYVKKSFSCNFIPWC